MTSNGGNPPDIAYLVASFGDVQGLAKGLRQAGFQGIIVNPTTYDPRIVKAAESLEVYTQWATPESADTNANVQEGRRLDPEAGPEGDAQPGHARRLVRGRHVHPGAEGGGEERDHVVDPEGHGEDDV